MNREIKILFQYLKRILLANKFPFQRYIVCYAKVCRSKIIGLCVCFVCVGGGGGGGG